MISQKTKRVAVLSGVVFLGMCVFVALAIRMIVVESVFLSEQVAAIAIDQSQQVAFTRLEKLVQETAGERSELRSFFLESQSDSIDFLNYIERLATERGITLETINPKEIEVEGKTFLSVEYSLEGSLGQVEEFIQLLENIPYVSQLTAVDLERRSSVVWQADIIINVAVLTYESTL
jgi:Tfp pilus assembly protein PilO